MASEIDGSRRERPPTNGTLRPGVTLARRRLLAALSAGPVIGLLGACAGWTPEPVWSRSPPLPPPASPPPPVPAGTPGPSGAALDAFLGLSAVLTGFDGLEPALGRAYLAALLARPDDARALDDLYAAAGIGSASPPATIDDLAARGVFGQERMRQLADTIIEHWYTGIIEGPEGPRVITFVDALTWPALTFTKPPSLCGPRPAFWEERPPVMP